MKSFLICDGTGRILRCGYCMEADLEAQARLGEQLLEAEIVDGNANYILFGAVLPRPTCPITATAAARVVTLNGVPVGAVIHVGGEADETITQSDPSGVLEVTLPAAGTYYFACDPFPAIAYAQDFAIP